MGSTCSISVLTVALLVAHLRLASGEEVFFRPLMSPAMPGPGHSVRIEPLGVELLLFGTAGRWMSESLAVGAGHRWHNETIEHRGTPADLCGAPCSWRAKL